MIKIDWLNWGLSIIRLGCGKSKRNLVKEKFFKNFKNTFDNLISIGYYIEESLIACVSAFLVVGAQLYFVKKYLCKMIETCPISD